VVEDICQYCYAFANCHRYLSNCALQERDDDDIEANLGSDDVKAEEGAPDEGGDICGLIIEREIGPRRVDNFSPEVKCY